VRDNGWSGTSFMKKGTLLVKYITLWEKKFFHLSAGGWLSVLLKNSLESHIFLELANKSSWHVWLPTVCFLQ